MRVLILNNYSIESVWKEIKAGEKPPNHIYGVDYLAKMGMEVIIAPFNRNSTLVKISNFFLKYFPIPLGDLDQQWSALKMFKKYDIIYSPCQTQTWLLSYLRALKLFKKPILAIAHHPFKKGRLDFLRTPFFKLSFKGIDYYPALSKIVSEEINKIAGKNKSKPIFWGPDLNYFNKSEEIGDKIIVAGRTGRDFVTFGKALTQLKNIKAKIICLKNDYKEEFRSFGDNIEVVVHDNPIDYKEMVKEYANARFIAIPCHYSKNLSGLTSFNDALALSKAIIMTKTEYIDIDLEKEGIGFWVNPDDVENWKKIIQENWNDIDTIKKMGRKGRELAESGKNSETFNKEIFALIKSISLENDII